MTAIAGNMEGEKRERATGREGRREREKWREGRMGGGDLLKSSERLFPEGCQIL